MTGLLNLDFDSLTIEELVDFEEASGMSAAEIAGMKAVPMKALRALVWIIRRRDDSTFTLADAGKQKVSELDLEEQVPPTKAARPTSKRSRASASSGTSAPSSSGG